MTDQGTADGGIGWRTVVVAVVVAIGVTLGMVWFSESESSTGDAPTPDKPSEDAMSELIFAVWGSEAEIAAYQAVVDVYNKESVVVDVRVVDYDDARSMLQAIRSETITPDLYLLPREDLAETVAEGRNRPLLDLLDARGVPLGDDYSRDAISAFATADDLQCMPYTSSPMVLYYNTKLIDFERMELRGLDVPSEDRDEWSLTEFRAAAEFASRPRNNTHGVYIEPTLEGLAPFVYSGGGQVYDDEVDPTSLALGDDDSSEALRASLEVLRDPRITLSGKQLEQRSPLEWFRDGQLGMIAGYRDLTPALRDTEGLSFDVMPMPTLDDPATVGRLTGLCVADGPADREAQAADFLVYMLNDEAVAQIAETGYLMPTNLEVNFDPAFLQPEQQPENARVFTSSVRSIVLPPLYDLTNALHELVGADLEALLTVPVLEDLDAALDAIDEKSRAVLDSDYEPPSEEPSGSPSGSASGSSAPEGSAE